LSEVVKIGIVKTGCIGTLPLIEFLLDERAERTDIETRVVGTGSNLGKSQCVEVAKLMVKLNPDFAVVIGPAQSAPGPVSARKILSSAGIPTIVISDDPTKRIKKELEDEGYGYFIIGADSMIGARREFLDPIEMAIFNSDVIKVLANTGVYSLIIKEIDSIIESLKGGIELKLPKIIINKNNAIAAGNFENPYAKAKMIAAFEMARHVADLNVEGCFREKDATKYVPIITAAHEMMRIAAKMSDEARELEKSNDTILRTPHHRDGTIRTKRKMNEKLQILEK
jgi:methylenetetrahydromethanopterin dehydrogenase